MTYKPYTGGAGPSAKLITGNNLEMLKALSNLGFACEYIDISQEIGSDMPLMVIRTKSKTGCTIEVGYDRWGFVTGFDGKEGEDQIGFDETVRWVITHKIK